jgi:hypothetical protein
VLTPQAQALTSEGSAQTGARLLALHEYFQLVRARPHTQHTQNLHMKHTQMSAHFGRYARTQAQHEQIDAPRTCAGAREPRPGPSSARCVACSVRRGRALQARRHRQPGRALVGAGATSAIIEHFPARLCVDLRAALAGV